MNLFNSLFHLDCIDFMSELPDKIFDHTITDIPYDIVNRHDNGIRNFDKANADVLFFELINFVDLLCKKTKDKIFVFCSSEQVSQLTEQFEINGFYTTLAIWEKNNPSPVNGQHIWLSGIECCVYAQRHPIDDSQKDMIWRYSSGRSKFHPTEKPLPLLEHIITTYTQKGDFIYDPCSGSASTLEAAAKHGRKFCGTELYYDYFMYGLNRMTPYF